MESVGEREREMGEMSHPSVEAPIFSSLTQFQSLPRGQEHLASLRHLPGGGHQQQQRRDQELGIPTSSRTAYLRPAPPYPNSTPPNPYSSPYSSHLPSSTLLSEPISPPKQFDSSYLRHQQQQQREEAY